MKKKVALFIDWENLRLDIASVQRNNPDFRAFDYNNPEHLFKLFSSFINDNEEIYRIFFYTAPPKTSVEIEKSLKTTNKEKFKNIYKTSKDLIYNIAKKPYIALRLGELKINGILDNGKPIISQKQVDMLLGLDISHVSYNKLVDSVLIFCKDSDITPALKTARINGLLTIIAHIESGFKITNSLIKHSDIIRKQTTQNIIKSIL